MQTHHPETRKPAFRWLGLNGKPENRTADSVTLSDSKKRIFGTDLTNATTKRLKTDEGTFRVLKPHSQVRVKQEKENEDEREAVEKSYQFGPFAPAPVPCVGDSNDGKGNQAVDWESLASSYRPQYHNQGTFLRPIRCHIYFVRSFMAFSFCEEFECSSEFGFFYATLPDTLITSNLF